jgi:hypothetical protein
MFKRQKGIALPVVIALAFILLIVGYALLSLAQQEIIQTRIETDKTRAFYYAEAGLAKLSETLQRPISGNLNEVMEGSIEQGSYRVVLSTNQTPIYAISTGTSGVVLKKIRVQANFLVPSFENAVFAMNGSGGSWAFRLRGTGNPVPYGSGERGGKDIINGNIFVDGDVFMYEESSVNQAPAPNPWQLKGDIGATGNISVLGSASISGSRNPNSEEPGLVDLTAMDYAVNNTHNVSQIFQDAGVTSGYLPAGASLRDVFVKNPSDRGKECSSTPNNDYFLEPMSATGGGSVKDAQTPLHLGNDKVYYVDGDLWVHSLSTPGFNVDGKVTVVATGDIHICDNIKYADTNSMLGLVALGKYDSSGNRISGGDIFFGDPRYGTMYVVSAMMFAANDFLYNSEAVFKKAAEPAAGFMVNGSFTAMNRVQVERDWYTDAETNKAMAAYFDPSTGQWRDRESQLALTAGEVGTRRHYQMIINYDDRVRNSGTQPPGLPRGGTKVFAGFSNWEEL